MTNVFQSHLPLLVSLGLTLTHFLWQGLLLAALLAVVLRLMRRSTAQTRYAACGVALLAMVICVPITFSWVNKAVRARGYENPFSYPDPQEARPSAGIHVVRPPAKPGEEGGLAAATRSGAVFSEKNRDLGSDAKPLLSDSATSAARGRGSEVPAPARGPNAVAARHEPKDSGGMATAVGRHAAEASKSSTSSVTQTEALSWWQDRPRREHVLAMGLSAAATLWALGVIVLGLRLIGGWAVLRRWHQQAQAIPSSLTARIEQLSSRLGLATIPAIRASQACLQPLAFGLFRPVVLLPIAAITQLPTELLEAMIAHELAHIRRHDLWVNLLQRIAEILLFYHPAVWWVSGRMRLERELCCDDLAVRATGRRVEYAESLVALARNQGDAALAALAVGLLGSRTTLAARIRRVLQLPTPPERTRAWLAGPVSVMILATLTIAAAVAPSVPRTRATAEETAKPTTQPMSVSTARPSPVNTMIRLDFNNTPLEKAIAQFAEKAGLPILGLDGIDPASKVKPVNLVISQPLAFDDALTTLDQRLFRVNYWMTLGDHGLVIDQLTEWYRFIPAQNWFGSLAEYRAARLPGRALAKLLYRPQANDPEAVANLCVDAVPINGARASVQPDAAAVELYGFVYFIDQQLGILAKRDVEGTSRSQARVVRPIQTGDWLNIRVLSLQSPQPLSDLSQTVDENGDIYIPMLGKKSARGSTPAQLRDKLIEVLVPNIYRDAGVLVEYARDADASKSVSPAQPATPLRPKPPQAAATPMPASQPTEHLAATRHIQRGDWLSIRALDFLERDKESDLSQTVDENGDVYLPGAGKLNVVGSTPSLVRDKIILTAKTSGIYREDSSFPAVFVEFGRSTDSTDSVRTDVKGAVEPGPDARPSKRRSGPTPQGSFLSAEKMSLRDQMDLAAQARSRSVSVYPMVDGIVSEVTVHAGQHVKKGDLLIRLDDAEIKLELEKAKVGYEQADSTRRHLLDLRKAGLSGNEQEELGADAQRRLAQIELQRLEIRLERTRIASPADGVVRGKPIGPGMKVNAGEEVMQVLPAASPAGTQPAESGREGRNRG